MALYGRRRVGKTFLINQVFKKRLAFSVTGVLGGGPDEQMEAFVDALETYSGEAVKRPKTWMQAFILLKKHLTRRCASSKHCIVFIDELPSFDTQRSGFVRALGYFWNSWASLQDKVTLIVCGSATSWMIRNVVDDKGGLHDRITHEMHLRPFSLYEVEVYLKSRGFVWNRLSVLQAYMVFGFLPKFAALTQIIPTPVLGAAMIAMFGLVITQGMTMLVPEISKSMENSLIVACAVGLGVGVSVVPSVFAGLPSSLSLLFSNGIVTGSVTAIVLNILFNMLGKSQVETDMHNVSAKEKAHQS